MIISFTREMILDMQEVDKMFKQNLVSWWDKVSPHYEDFKCDTAWVNISAFILLTYKHMQLEKGLTLQMVNIFKTLYFANYIHSLVKDEEEGQLYNQDLQFNILISDYIFGRVLEMLIEADAVNLLTIFTELISCINEGMVLKHKVGTSYVETLKNTKVPFFAATFSTAAKLANVKPDKAVAYKQLGNNLGMAVLLADNNRYMVQVEEYMEESCKIAASLSLKANDDLYNLINQINQQVIQSRKLAAVGG